VRLESPATPRSAGKLWSKRSRGGGERHGAAEWGRGGGGGGRRGGEGEMVRKGCGRGRECFWGTGGASGSVF
jgi:hypothetical protein